jgi:hypothetical protein
MGMPTFEKLADYTGHLEKFVVVSEKSEQDILEYYLNAKSIRFIGNNQAIINLQDYNTALETHVVNIF